MLCFDLFDPSNVTYNIIVAAPVPAPAPAPKPTPPPAAGINTKFNVIIVVLLLFFFGVALYVDMMRFQYIVSIDCINR